MRGAADGDLRADVYQQSDRRAAIPAFLSSASTGAFSGTLSNPRPFAQIIAVYGFGFTPKAVQRQPRTPLASIPVCISADGHGHRYNVRVGSRRTATSFASYYSGHASDIRPSCGLEAQEQPPAGWSEPGAASNSADASRSRLVGNPPPIPDSAKHQHGWGSRHPLSNSPGPFCHLEPLKGPMPNPAGARRAVGPKEPRQPHHQRQRPETLLRLMVGITWEDPRSDSTAPPAGRRTPSPQIDWRMARRCRLLGLNVNR